MNAVIMDVSRSPPVNPCPGPAIKNAYDKNPTRNPPYRGLNCHDGLSSSSPVEDANKRLVVAVFLKDTSLGLRKGRWVLASTTTPRLKFTMDVGTNASVKQMHAVAATKSCASFIVMTSLEELPGLSVLR